MNSKRWMVGGALFLLSGGAMAGLPGARPMLAPGESPAPAADVDPAKLSPQDSIVRAKQMLTQMNNTETRVTALQKRAESKKDMVQINCVSDKLVQVKGYVAVGSQAAAGVEIAATRNDEAARVHNFDRTSIVHQKVLVLGTEAEGCAGEDVSYIGATRVEVEIDPSIPEVDPTIPPVIGVIPAAPRPPEASPFA